MGNNRLWLMVGGVVAIIAIGLGLAWQFSHSSKPPAPKQHVTNYAGFDQLIDKGLTVQQLNKTRDAVAGYLRSANRTGVNEVDVTPNSISKVLHDANGLPELSFTLTFDGKPLGAKLEYDIDTIRLWLTNPASGNQVYDSKTF